MKTLVLLLTLFFLSLPAWARSTTQSSELRQELQKLSQKNASLKDATLQIQKRYGTKAYLPLLQIAKDHKKSSDEERTLAFLAAVRVGGTSAESEIIHFLSDSSWMLRMAAIKVALALQLPKARQALLGRLEDRALVIRSAVAHALTRIYVPNSTPALKKALQTRSNYHKGKPLPIIQTLQKALAAQAVPTLEVRD